MKKQTAVEWLKDWMGKNQYFIGNDLLEAIEQAKAMEKEQIAEAYIDGEDDETNRRVLKRAAEQYYNETYGSDK
jgi:hypothetical protein